MHRFFITPEDIQGKHATLPPLEAHHLRTVRLSHGEQVELLDGKGTVYRALLVKNGNRPTLEILSEQVCTPDTPLLSIGQGLLKGKKMDFVLQKATELGVREFFPFHSENCVVTAPKNAKFDRWEKISMEACKQSGNPFLMNISEPLTFSALLQASGKYEEKLLFWEQATDSHLSDYRNLSSVRSIIAITGPEGGLSREEVDSAITHGFTVISLGKRILRAETAALAVTSILQHLGGNL